MVLFKSVPRYIITICFIIAIQISYSQQSKPDSLQFLIDQMTDDTLKVKLLIECGSNEMYQDAKTSMRYAMEAMDLSQKLYYTRGKALGYLLAGKVYFFTSDYMMAIQAWKWAATYFSMVGDWSGVANALSNTGAAFYNQRAHDKALEFNLKALGIAEKIGDKKRIATVQQNIGAMHSERGEYEQALKAYLGAQKAFKEVNYIEGYGLSSLNIGKIYTAKNKHREAMEMYLIAKDCLRGTSYMMVVYRQLGAEYIKMGDFMKGKSYLDSSLYYAKNMEDNFEASLTFYELAEGYSKNGDNKNSILYYELAKISALKIDSANAALEQATAGLIGLYETAGNYQKAFENLKLNQRIKEFFYNLETDRKFNEQLYNFELQKKESEIMLLLKEQELQK